MIFFALHYSRLAGSARIEPEHLLEGLLHEDPKLFHLVMPENPNLVHELQTKLTATRSGTPITVKRDTPLSLASKGVVLGAGNLQEKFGHSQVANQHLLLALLKYPEPVFRWFNKWTESPMQSLLVSSGITAQLVENKIKEGIITAGTWILDDDIVALNAQISALAEILIAKKVFTRSEFVSVLDRQGAPIPSETFLLPLIESLKQKGVLTPAEQEQILSTRLGPKKDDTKQ